MNLNEIDALRYSLGRIQTTLYPKQYAYEEIVSLAKLTETEFSEDTITRLRKIQIEIKGKMEKEKDQLYAYLYYLNQDIENVTNFLRDSPLDFTDIKEKLLLFAKEVAIPEIRNKLGIAYDVPPIHIVSEMPLSQLGRPSRSGGFGSDQWQEERYGIPRGIYLGEASVVPDSETLLIHELTHPAVEAFPNFVEWFDEGLCNFMAFWIYSEQIGNLNFRRNMKMQEEFGDYFVNPGRLFRRPDNMFCSLFVIGGLDIIKLLMHYKRENPSKVKWNLIPKLLQQGTDLQTLLKNVVEDPVKLPEPILSPIQRRIIATVLAHDISHVLSPLALLLFTKILERKPYPPMWRPEELLTENITQEGIDNAITELRNRGPIIWMFPDGHFEPYMGPFIGTNYFIEAGLVRAWARKYEPMDWGK